VIEAVEVSEQRNQPSRFGASRIDEGIEEPDLDVGMARKARQQAVQTCGVDVVDEKSHPDSARRGVAQRTQHLLARGVVGDEVGLQVDRRRRVLDRRQPGVERERRLGHRPGPRRRCIDAGAPSDVGERRSGRSDQRRRDRLPAARRQRSCTPSKQRDEQQPEQSDDDGTHDAIVDPHRRAGWNHRHCLQARDAGSSCQRESGSPMTRPSSSSPARVWKPRAFAFCAARCASGWRAASRKRSESRRNSVTGASEIASTRSLSRVRDPTGRRAMRCASEADERVERGRRQRAIDPAVALRQVGVEVVRTQQRFERAAAAHESDEVLEPPAPGSSPNACSGWPKIADSRAANRMSHARANSLPRHARALRPARWSRGGSR
jgi:hypothetical protein